MPPREPMEVSRRGGAGCPPPYPPLGSPHVDGEPFIETPPCTGVWDRCHGGAARLLPIQGPTTHPARQAEDATVYPALWKQTVASTASTPGAETPCPTFPASRARRMHRPCAIAEMAQEGRSADTGEAARADSLRLLVPTSARAPAYPPRRGPLSHVGAVTPTVP